MIYSAKIRRMSKRRRKIAVRRRIRKILRADLQPFIGQRVGREMIARMIRAMAESLRQMAEAVPRVEVISYDREHAMLHARVILERRPAFRTPVFHSAL